MSISLVVGGIELPDENRVTLNQEYERLKAGRSRALQSGAVDYREAWSGKLATTISGTGWSSCCLAGVDFSQPVVVKCIASRSVSSLVDVVAIAMPVARRSDVPVVGYAIVDGGLVETEVLSDVGGVVTLAPVANNKGYKVDYWPELTLVDIAFRDGLVADAAIWSWSLSGREQ